MKPVQEFQIQNGLIPDGIIGPITSLKMSVVWGLSAEPLAHFLGQCHHETAGFTLTSENLYYSAKGLLRVFGKYFNNHDAGIFEHQPERIANRVYANRIGNGDEESGDGWKFRGRGSIQLTGRANYERFANKVKDMSILDNPDQVANRYFWDAGFFYFNDRNLWAKTCVVNNESIIEITKIINGGTNGLQDRIKLTNHYYNL